MDGNIRNTTNKTFNVLFQSIMTAIKMKARREGEKPADKKLVRDHNISDNKLLG